MGLLYKRNELISIKHYARNAQIIIFPFPERNKLWWLWVGVCWLLSLSGVAEPPAPWPGVCLWVWMPAPGSSSLCWDAKILERHFWFSKALSLDSLWISGSLSFPFIVPFGVTEAHLKPGGFVKVKLTKSKPEVRGLSGKRCRSVLAPSCGQTFYPSWALFQRLFFFKKSQTFDILIPKPWSSENLRSHSLEARLGRDPPASVSFIKIFRKGNWKSRPLIYLTDLALLREVPDPPVAMQI